MGIDNISLRLVEPADRVGRLLFCGVSADKHIKSRLHLIGNSIDAFFAQILHEGCCLLRAVAADMVDQAFQVAGDQDIHGRRAGQDEIAVAVIGACRKEVKQHLIGVGCADQLTDRQSHPGAVIGGEDIAEVACRDNDIDLFALTDHTLLQKSGVCKNIVDDLRNKTSYVDRIGGGEGKAFFCHFFAKCLVAEDLLDFALGIVKIASNADNTGVVSLLGHHLALLNGRNAVLWIKDHDPGALDIRKACHGRLAGVAAGRGQDDDLLLLMILARGSSQKVRQNLQSHILEGNGGTVEKFQEAGSVRTAHRYNLLVVEVVSVSIADACFQLFLCKIGQHKLHHFISDAAIIHLCQIGQADVERREGCGYKKTSVFCKSHENGLGSGNRSIIGARALI